jgi:hypothetical protein
LQRGNTHESISRESRFPNCSSLVIRFPEAQDQMQYAKNDPVANRSRRGNMDDLIGWPASKAGNDVVVAEKIIGRMLGFLRSEGPSDKAQALINGIPGAETAIVAASTRGGPGKLTGNGTGEIHSIARELFELSRDKIGADQMGEIIAGTPGLSQFA